MQYSGPPSSGPPRPVRVDPKRQRARMVRELESRGINDAAVLAAMNAVPRHLFVQEALRAHAYEDTALPIGYGQTISQPSTVARMTMLLETFPGCRVLEVGTGSGYQTAVLAALGCVVITIECVRELHQHTRRLFQSLALRDVHSLFGDGTLGLPDMQSCRFAVVGRDGLLEFETIDDYVKIHIMSCLGEPVMLVKREQSEKVYHLSMDQLRAFDLIDYL